MKTIALPMIMLVAIAASGQEFKVYNNGLIYSEETMAQLGRIVDSLNIKFRKCDLSQTFYSTSQGFATRVRVPNGKARQDIKNKIDFGTYVKRYPQATKKVWITKAEDWYDEDHKIILHEIGNDGNTTIPFTSEANRQVSGWIVVNDKTAWFLHEVKPREIPVEYARLIQYVDCMIDTTAYIFTEKARTAEPFDFSPPEENLKGNLFVEFAERYPDRPTFDYDRLDSLGLDIDSASTAFDAAYDEWNNSRLRHLDSQVQTFPQLKTWLVDASNEALVKGNSDERLEFYIARYISKETALELKRGRKVYGFCSQDTRPRNHAVSICLLSAETSSWDIFLRSHLDIMNDRFERASDGSYAWAQRETYIRELEQLDINTTDLLIGICLSADNVSDNHYWGSIPRVGRALAETEDKKSLEAQLLKMIGSSTLDDLNRLRMAYLFAHYSYNLQDQQSKAENFKKLDALVANMPDHLQKAWAWK